MPEGLSPAEVGHEIQHHRHDRTVTIVEAVLLAVVALLAAWSGFAASQWSTESRLALSRASTARVEASTASLEAMEQRNFDAEAFNTWFIAYSNGDQTAMEVAERRFTPEYRVAFEAWVATNPAANPDAPPGPTFMDEYEQPDLEKAEELNAKADELYDEGADAGKNGDDYVRTTVYLATVLFLVGISGHFTLRVARIGLVTVGVVVLVAASIALLSLPKPPT